MKTIATLIFFLFIGFAAQAQTATETVKVEIVKTEVVIVKEVKLETATEVARLYKNKNARVTKALKFSTKANKAKMA